MKQTFALLTILLIFTSQVFGQFQDLIKKNEKAVFAIYTYDDYGAATGIGTGFFISTDGIGLTNFHVLNGAARGIIKTVDGKTYQIDRIISSSEQADLIKFKVNTKGEITAFLTLKYTPLEKGEKVFVIGNPHGFESTVSEGIISSIRPSVEYGSVIQITAPISSGSSGSPVMTLDGKVIGVATYQFAKGQNLNFAVSISSISFLNTITTTNFITSKPNLLIINERCLTNSQLLLNSIEFKEYETVLNFSFTNVSMGFGESMQIWTNFQERDETFVIQDLNTLQNYFAKSATIGTSRENGTSIGLGETKRFKVIFPQIPRNLKRINIIEGISSSWKFLNLDLTKYTNIEQQNTESHNKNIALTKLENKKFEEAKTLLSDVVQTNKYDHDAYNIMGIISYILDNNYDALTYFSKAIELSPIDDIYYFNRYTVYRYKDDYINALKDINSAIKIKPYKGDYYQYRAIIFTQQKEWKKAVSDWDMAINIMGEGYYLLKYRGLCKSWLEDFSGACRDFNLAYKLDDFQDSQLKQWIEQNCK
jgi:serine protease Do